MKPYQFARLLTRSNQAGFTIVEALVGILVAAALLTAIAPVLVISAATRVQARRIELATQAARGYLDGIQTGSITTIPPISSGSADQIPAPTSGSLTCNANSYCTAPAPTSQFSLYCIDRNGNSDNTPDGKCTNNSSQDLILQVFGIGSDNTSYRLGVRVYRADAFQGSGALKRNSDANSTTNGTNNPLTALTYATGLGDRRAALLEMSTDVNPSQPSYTSLCARLGGCS